jgi:hypothetical protein
MTQNPIQYLHGEVTVFNSIEKLNALHIMEKPANPILLAEFRQAYFPEMPVRDMAYIMAESNCFNQIFVQSKASPDRPCDLRYDLHMDNTVGDVVVFDKIKDLRLVDIPRVCSCMDDPISIPGIRSTDIIRFSVVPSHCVGTGRSERR